MTVPSFILGGAVFLFLAFTPKALHNKAQGKRAARHPGIERQSCSKAREAGDR
jgi:hypothetical protein